MLGNIFITNECYNIFKLCKEIFFIPVVSLCGGLIGLILIGKNGFMGVAGVCMFLIALVLTVINYLDISAIERLTGFSHYFVVKLFIFDPNKTLGF